MTPYSLVLIIACVGISAGVVFAEDVDVANTDGTVRGRAVGTTSAENPNGFEQMSQDSHGHWYDYTLMNTKIGYMHISAEKTEYQGEQLTRHKSDIVINLKALGTDLALEITNVEYVGADLTLRHFLHTSNMSGLKQVEGRIVNGIASIKTTLNGATTESEVSVPSDTISQSAGVEALLSQAALKIGDKRTFHVFSFDLMKPVKAEIEVVRQETLTYQSEEKQVYVLDGTLDMMGGTTIKQWISPEGVNYRTETLLMGVPQVAIKTDKETALGDIEEVDLILKNPYPTFWQTPYTEG